MSALQRSQIERSSIAEGLVWFIALPAQRAHQFPVYGSAVGVSSAAPPPLGHFGCGAEIDSSSDKERPINMMEGVVNLRPDDSSQARWLLLPVCLRAAGI